MHRAVDRDGYHSDSRDVVISFHRKINGQAGRDRIVNTDFFNANSPFSCISHSVFLFGIKRFFDSGIGINCLSESVTYDDDCFGVMQTYRG